MKIISQKMENNGLNAKKYDYESKNISEKVIIVSQIMENGIALFDSVS